MLHSIGTCLWFDGKAKEAAHFYKEVFGEVVILSENPMAVVYNIFGRRFMNLNGGPGYPINPSISFFISVDTEAEMDAMWEKLIVDGKILMPLNKYPWSEKYGWCADRYGVNWQLMLGHKSRSRIMPNLMFTGNQNGNAKQAIEYYSSLFTNSNTVQIDTYQKGEPDTEGNIKYAQFELDNLSFGAMDSSAPHQFSFNEGVSFIITVDTQEEIDNYWNYLVKEGAPGRCGWLKDKFGVSWQIVPSILGKLMTNPVTAPKATYAFLQMSKFIIADLEKAVE
ncbi:MAG: VOC family protein [Bacteroidetes bacterium]|jgi:predicted 3-demethylubiquinone-9 3-methyltransferase (glyoxalase superfamily)|nr:VOC family protein [Bacteroidota bacterium]